MDPIHPIVPNESRMPILPALGPEAIRREQRRNPDQQERPRAQPEPADDYGEEPDDEREELSEWDGLERRATAPELVEEAEATEQHRAGGEDEPPGAHIDITV